MGQKDEIRDIANWIAGIKRRRRFVSRGESRRLAAELQEILDDLDNLKPEPRKGAKIVARFYQTDEAILGNCDDSSGYVGDVYREDARNLFLQYATQCEDKAWLADLVLVLNQEDPMGVRDSLIRCAGQYLPEQEIRSMVATFQDWTGLVFPNPFNGTVHLQMENEGIAQVASHFEVYDLRGRLVHSRELHSPIGIISWDGKDMRGQALESGCFVCVVRGLEGDVVYSRKITYLK